MKSIILFILLVFSLNVVASELGREVINGNQYKLTTINYDNRIVFKFKTTFVHICPSQLITKSIKITKEARGSYGLIEIETYIDQNSSQVTIGRHYGEIEIMKGQSLPNLPNGTYEIIIDGESYGYLKMNGRGFEIGNG